MILYIVVRTEGGARPSTGAIYDNAPEARALVESMNAHLEQMREGPLDVDRKGRVEYAVYRAEREDW